MGIIKLKTVYWNEQSLSIGNVTSKNLIPLNDIKNIGRTFLFDDLPFKIKYTKSGELKTLYFLPKSSIFQDMMSENKLIEELKKANPNNM